MDIILRFALSGVGVLVGLAAVAVLARTDNVQRWQARFFARTNVVTWPFSRETMERYYKGRVMYYQIKSAGVGWLLMSLAILVIAWTVPNRVTP